MYVNIFIKKTCLKWTLGLFGHNYRVATLSTFYLTVDKNDRTILTCLIYELLQKKQIVMFKMDVLVLIIEFFASYKL